jgi:hypothetical protein
MLFIHTTRPMTSATTTTAATLTQIANQFLLPAAACAITSMLSDAAVAAVLPLWLTHLCVARESRDFAPARAEPLSLPRAAMSSRAFSRRFGTFVAARRDSSALRMDAERARWVPWEGLHAPASRYCGAEPNAARRG